MFFSVSVKLKLNLSRRVQQKYRREKKINSIFIWPGKRKMEREMHLDGMEQKKHTQLKYIHTRAKWVEQSRM